MSLGRAMVEEAAVVLALGIVISLTTDALVGWLSRRNGEYV